MVFLIASTLDFFMFNMYLSTIYITVAALS